MKRTKVVFFLNVVVIIFTFIGQLSGQEKDRATDTGETHFTFTKTGSLISRPVDMPKPGPYYPCLVKMDGVDKITYAR
jgi:hypothetical protein